MTSSRARLLAGGVAFMLAASVASAMDYYSFCPPGANCGTSNPGLNLAIIAVNFFVGLALVVASVTKSGPKQPI